MFGNVMKKYFQGKTKSQPLVHNVEAINGMLAQILIISKNIIKQCHTNVHVTNVTMYGNREQLFRLRVQIASVGNGMKNNLIKITDNMSAVKGNLPEWTWDDIVRCGLSLARLLECDDNQHKYKQLYWLSKKNIKELSASFR